MKKTELLLSMVFLVIVSLSFHSCGGHGSKPDTTNEQRSDSKNFDFTPTDRLLFGDLSEIVSKYKNKIAVLEVEKKNVNILGKGVKLNMEIKAIKTEADNAIGAYLKNLRKPITVPVIQEGNEKYYNISEMVVENVSLNEVVFIANVEMKKNYFPGDTVYIQLFIDDDPIKDWLLLKSSGIKKAGQIYQFRGGVNPEKLLGVTKVIAKTPADYLSEKK